MSNPKHDPRSPSAPPGIPAQGTPLRAALLGYVLLMALLLLVPVPHRLDALASRFDGVAHFVIFLVFSLLYQSDSGPAVARTLSITAVLAGGTELLQWALPYRGGQWSDFAMGVAGAGAGVVLSLLAARWPRGTPDASAHTAPTNGGAR